MKLLAIVGAGRSGTNLLAQTLAADGEHIKNLYENRYIWSYGQADRRCDVRGAEDATPRVQRYISAHFARRGERSKTAVLIDKTPSNALRIPFLAQVFPDVLVLNIIRDGRDNMVSRARQRDLARVHGARGGSLVGGTQLVARRILHLSRLMQRGNLPVDRLPVALFDSVSGLTRHALGKGPPPYGERVAGLAACLASEGPDAAAAFQWRETVVAAHRAGRALGPRQYLEIRFEDLMTDPQRTLATVFSFIGCKQHGGARAYLRDQLKTPRPPPRQRTDPARLAALERHLRPTLEHFGYVWET
ncbi:MAG: sulfotransferase [Pseudomonadota bacterium]